MAQRTDTEQIWAVRKMRIIATSLLACVTVLFILSVQLPPDNPWRALLRAFSEAAMVGALADWFAVSALFRRPMGLPIPHTAIIPSNKDRIGANFGSFVERNFLSQEIIDQKLAQTDIAGTTAQWLSKRENASFVIEKVSAIVPPVLETISEREINEILYEGISKQLQSIEIAPILGKGLRIVIAGDRHKLISNEILNILGQLVDENKLLIKKKVREESPWFVPDFIDNKIYEKIITQLRSLILEIKDNPKHNLRQLVATKVVQFVDSLSTNPDYRDIGEVIKRELLSSPAVKEAFLDFCKDLKEAFTRGLMDSHSELQGRLAGILEGVSQVVLQDPELRLKINGWTRAGILAVLRQHSHQIAELISETVRKWDSSTLVDKFELEIGRDLQFIRINGTIVGGIIGILIWLAEQSL